MTAAPSAHEAGQRVHRHRKGLDWDKLRAEGKIRRYKPRPEPAPRIWLPPVITPHPADVETVRIIREYLAARPGQP